MKKAFFKVASILLIFLMLFSYSSSYAMTEKPPINGSAAILVELSTGKIIYEKNSKQKMYPASTTKIMTAIVVLENSNLSDPVIVTENAISNIPSGYVTCNLVAGETQTVESLLYALLLPSANDAAYVLAEHIGGSTEGFANMMNEKASKIGCTGTHFVNPNGIHNDAQYTTAYDLYLIGKYAMQNEEFRKIVSTLSYTLPPSDKYPYSDRILETTNQLINPNSSSYYYNYALGIKTGHTTEAGNCLVSMASRDNLEFVSVVLDASKTSQGLDARFTDTKKLFEYGYDNYTLTKLHNENDIIKTIEIENGSKDTKILDLLIKDPITVMNSKDTNVEEIEPEITLTDPLLAPITKGDEVGTIKFTVDNIEYTSTLLAGSDVEKKPNYALILIIVGFILLVIGLRLFRKPSRKKTNRRKR